MAHYPPPNNPDVVKVALLFSRDTRTLVNTFHVEKAGGWSLADLNNLATVVLNWYNTFYKIVVPAAVALTGMSFRVYNPTVPLALDVPVSPPSAGTRTGTAEAGNATSTLSLRTGLAGKAHRGRMYVPALPEPDVSQTDQLASALTTGFATAASNLISAIFKIGRASCRERG